MPSGVAVGRSVKREFFDLVCRGMTTTEASVNVGVARRTGWLWWRHAGGVKLRKGGCGLGGVAAVGNPVGIGGRGHRLDAAERVEIMRGLDAGLSCAAIGRRLGRDRSVIWREVQRNRLPDGDYHALMADTRAAERARRPKAFKLDNRRLCHSVTSWMDDGWSPQLISTVLARDFADDKLMQVSHETLYQSLYVQTRGQLRADLSKRLSTHRAVRKPRTQTERRGKFTDVITISQRPAEAADRAVPGHWEGDLIIGARGASAIGTLVERSTRFTILLHLPLDHHAETVATAMIEAMSELPHHLRRSVAWDRGSEMAGWQDISLQLQAPVYFCDPHSPWQRGTNENTNRLLRHWFEKGADLSTYTPDDLKIIAAKLNSRPRPTLDLDTPAQRMAALISQAA
ncbi:IS30 family transposase [Mycolicibacterium psychrotolerans]|nr:IS30 family transposase [Mycolicibacterium psychrotolerans]